MITVVVVTGCILNDRCNPDGCETQSLDVVELVDHTLESPRQQGSFVLICSSWLSQQSTLFLDLHRKTRGHHKK